MRDNQIRDVTFLDMVVRPDPNFAPCCDMRYFISELQKLFQANQTHRWNRRGDQKTYVRDLEVNLTDHYALLLLYYNNGNASAASYSHLDTNQHRIVPPLNREGRAETAHLLINLNSGSRTEDRYMALLEDATKINRHHVQMYLSFLFKEIKKANPAAFQAPHPDGSNNANGSTRMYKYSNKFEIQGHLSSEFISMLENGRLTGIALETSRHDRFAVGDGAYVSPTKRELKLAPTVGKWSEHPMERFREAVSLGNQNDYEQARITFLAPDKKSHTVRVDTNTGNILGERFVKRKRLNGFSHLLSDAETSIHQEIKSKMLEIFR